MATATKSLATVVTALSGGVDPIAAVGPTKHIVVTGSWDAGDVVTLTAIINETQFDLGGGEMLGVVPVHAMTYDNKVYLSSGDRVYFSGVQEPTGWERRFFGFSFIAASGQRGEALEVKAAAVYGKKLVVLSRNVTQLWEVDPDPTQYRLVQVLDNVGTVAAASVVSYGELDLFFLSDSGVRSVRSRELLDLVNVHDVGTPIDPTIQGVLAGLTDTQKERAFGLFNPLDGRYWLYIHDRFYIFSYFPGSKVSAWSNYLDPEFVSVDPLVSQQFTTGVWFNGRLHFRFDLNLTESEPPGNPYTTTYFFRSRLASYSTGDVVTLVLPFLDAKRPLSRKAWQSVDVIGTGTWSISVGNDPNNITSFSPSMTLALSTVATARIPLSMQSTHLVLKLTCATNAAATIAAIGVRYQDLEVKV